jgi:3-oxosteroid 1-dehydrogenase
VSIQFDEEFDFVVVGSGAGALTGAITAAAQGLRVCLLEKTEFYGGTTAYSGGGVFIPNNPVILRNGVPDSDELGRDYLRQAIAGRSSETLQDAYMRVGPGMVAWLEERGYALFRWSMAFPDYHADYPSGMAMGRTMGPVPVEDVGSLSEVVRRIRQPLSRGQGGHPRPADPDRLIGGQALVARLLSACDLAGVALRLESPLEQLVQDESGAVVGVQYRHRGVARTVAAGRGVLLAAGGFERNEQFRRQYQPVGAAWSVSSPGNTGDAIRAGMRAGAAVDLMDDSWWTPSFVYPDNTTAFCLIERTLPGAIIVDATGERYANESLPYNQFGHAMLEFGRPDDPHTPSYLVFDQTYLDRYPMFGLPARTPVPQAWLDSRVMHRADSIEELGESLGLPTGVLAKTVARTNEFAARGKDEDFDRGEADFDRNLMGIFLHGGGLPMPDGPNPCLQPILQAPFYAAVIYPGDLGTKGGLLCDDRARVLREDGSAINGLYATGNSMASMMGNDYPGPGSTLGPAMVFAHIAALDVAGVCAEQ